MKHSQQEIAWEYLSEKHRKFAEAWVRTHNFSLALKEAGLEFNEKNPGNLARRLIKRAKTYIDYLETRAQQTQLVSIAAVQRQLVSLGYSNLLNYYTIDADTGDVRPKQIMELTREEGAAVKSWSTIPYKKKRKNADGTEIEFDIWVLHDIVLHEARGPLQDLMKSLGGFPQKPGEQAPTLPGQSRFSNLPPGEALRLDAALKRALSVLDSQRDADAIESRGADGAHQGDEPGQARTRALPPPASTKG